MDVARKRSVARELAIVVSDTGIRLAGYEHFPWFKAAEALATLDVCLGLATAVRWEDSEIVRRDNYFPSILETALSQGTLSPTQVAGLSPLLDHVSVESLDQIGAAAHELMDIHDLRALIEHLAQEEVLRFGQGRRQEVCKKLTSVLMSDNAGLWLDRLAKATAFHRVERPKQASPIYEQTQSGQRNDAKVIYTDPLAGIDWAAHRFVTEEDINSVLDAAFGSAQLANTYIASSTVLDRIGAVVALRDRVAHLEILSRGTLRRVSEYEVSQSIARRLDEWQEAPSVNHWCRERLLQVIVDRLPHFIRWITYGQAPIQRLLARSSASGELICSALMEAVEHEVDSFEAPTIYALVGVIGQYCTPDEAAHVIERYASRLVQRIPTTDQENWDLTDLPTDPADGVARVLYALMSDIDVRNRWRAAHAVRCLARLGDTGIINKLVGLYDRTTDPCYRNPDAPFYWLAARLWLVIALDRIATEAPSTVRHHGLWLLDIAKNEAFPHILVRSFAKSAVGKLLENGGLALDAAQRDTLKRANTSPLRRKKGRPSYGVGWNKYQSSQREDRRFRFDSMDTLPHWYTRALRSFADLRNSNSPGATGPNNSCARRS